MKKRHFAFLLTSFAIFTSACDKRIKENASEFPVTFDNLSIEVNTITKNDTTLATDSTYSKAVVTTNNVTSIIETAYNSLNDLISDNNYNLSYNEFRDLSGISISGTTESNVAVTYASARRSIAYDFKNNNAFAWDDSTVVFTLLEAGTQQPKEARVNYYQVHGGSKKTAFRLEDRILFNYNTAGNLTRATVHFIGVVDSIYDPTITLEQTNYDTNQAIIYAADTVAMPKYTLNYSSNNRENKIQSYYPLFYFGLEHYNITNYSYPRQIIKDTYLNGDVASTEYINFVYVNDAVTGEIKTIQEHHSTTGSQVNNQNLKVSYHIQKK